MVAFFSFSEYVQMFKYRERGEHIESYGYHDWPQNLSWVRKVRREEDRGSDKIDRFKRVKIPTS